MSFLSLTGKKSEKNYIDVILKNYNGLQQLEQMVNDIAFLKGEEPIISPKIWNSLTIGQKRKISRALVAPAYRFSNNSLEIIKIPQSTSQKLLDEDLYEKAGINNDLALNIISKLKRNN
jgi:hypothetical protein